LPNPPLDPSVADPRTIGAAVDCRNECIDGDRSLLWAVALDQSIDDEMVVDPNVPSAGEFEPRELRALVPVAILDNSN
jgi:hypothetical protein